MVDYNIFLALRIIHGTKADTLVFKVIYMAGPIAGWEVLQTSPLLNDPNHQIYGVARPMLDPTNG